MLTKVSCPSLSSVKMITVKAPWRVFLCIYDHVSLLHPGLSSLPGDGRLHPHPQYSHRAHQDPALLPQGPEPGPSAGVPCPQDLPRGEGQEARPLCLSNGVTQHCVLFSSLRSIQLTYTIQSVEMWEDDGVSRKQ